ncbi:phosphatase PAP2 family protein [Jatrophihabitans sp. DSM 45814]
MSALAEKRQPTVGVELRTSVPKLAAAAIAIWLVLFAVGHLLTHGWQDSAVVRWDQSVDRSFAGHRNPTLNTITHYLTFGAETATVITAGVVIFILLRVILKRWRESIFLAVTLIGEVTIFVSTTLVVDRARPTVAHLDSAPPTSSFPSGHTAAAVTLYASVAVIAFSVGAWAWLRWTLLALAILMPVGVTLSRLYRGMHYPTDVLAAALFALCWLLITRAVILRNR